MNDPNEPGEFWSEQSAFAEQPRSWRLNQPESLVVVGDWNKASAMANLPSSLPRRISPSNHSIIVPIQSFFPEPVEIIKPFAVVVRREGEEYIASFFDANINSSGDTDEEAVSNVKDMIVATFEVFGSKKATELGPEPERQMGVLRQFLKWAK